jgi:hypothetical protein
MVELFSTASRLWRDAPAWKGMVIAAGVFTVLSVAYLLNGSSAPVSGSATAPPPLPSDPASELRLADYEAAYDAAMKIAGVGERCEKMIVALGRLTNEDRERGRNVRASTKARIAALTAGDRCRSNIADSDKHFVSFETAIAAAETSPSPATITKAADATALLDGFMPAKRGCWRRGRNSPAWSRRAMPISRHWSRRRKHSRAINRPRFICGSPMRRNS